MQATWLGYPTTTGLSAIDFRLTDARADPPAHDGLAFRAAGQAAAQLLLLPAARTVAPLPGPLPALARGGEVTFGSFNNRRKISATTLDLWAGVLRAVPRSRLLLKAAALAYRPVRERLLAELGARGIDAERIDAPRVAAQGTPRRRTARSTSPSTPGHSTARRRPAKPCGWAFPWSPWPATGRRRGWA